MNSKERVELSISSSYLNHWTVYDALRELFQNSFDRAKEDEAAGWFKDVEPTDSGKIKLTIGNKNTALHKRTLILGETSKANNKSAIGKFGEGYKLAILVLLRNKVSVSIRTADERWEFQLEYSPSFETRVLVMYRFTDVHETENLLFQLDNLSKNMYHSYSQYNLELQDDVHKEITQRGELLLDKRNHGKIFVGGLYICKYEGDSLYGYNFKPDVFQLGRDRNIIAGVDADWEAAQIIVEATTKNVEVLAHVTDNLKDQSDTRFLYQFAHKSKKLISSIWDKFRTENPEGIPVHNQDQRIAAEQTYVAAKTINVSESMSTMLRRSDEYKEEIEELEEKEPEPTPYDILKEFYDEDLGEVSDYVRESFLKILEISKDWD